MYFSHSFRKLLIFFSLTNDKFTIKNVCSNGRNWKTSVHAASGRTCLLVKYKNILQFSCSGGWIDGKIWENRYSVPSQCDFCWWCSAVAAAAGSCYIHCLKRAQMRSYCVCILTSETRVYNIRIQWKERERKKKKSRTVKVLQRQ